MIGLANFYKDMLESWTGGLMNKEKCLNLNYVENLSSSMVFYM